MGGDERKKERRCFFCSFFLFISLCNASTYMLLPPVLTHGRQGYFNSMVYLCGTIRFPIRQKEQTGTEEAGRAFGAMGSFSQQ